MAKKLEKDVIEWILKLNADDAQAEYAKLNKANSELTGKIKERRAAMVQLEAQGKKETAEYKELQKEVKSLTSAQQDNNLRQKEITKNMGIAGMTMNQLSKRARELQYQLNNTSKATDPESYAKLEEQLGEVRNRMGELRNNGKNAEAQLGKIGMVAKGAALAGIAALGYAIKEIAVKSYETRKEFAKFEAILANTFQSQKKGEEAFAMLKDFARDTPYQLNQITETYIKMVNRGINPTKEELVKLGDVSAALGKSMDDLVEAQLDAMTGEFERLKEFGIKASKEGDNVKFTFRGVTTEVKYSDTAIKNYILSLGSLQGVQGSMAVQMNQLEGLQSNWNDTLDRIANNLGKRFEPAIKSAFKSAISLGNDLAGSLESVSDKYKSQMDNLTSLEMSMPKLLGRYDELKSKANLSKEEHEELNSVIQSIGNIVPGAITQWDAYGRAIGLNTDKVYEFMQAERARLKYLNKEAIKETSKDVESAKSEMAILMKKMKDGGEYKNVSASRGDVQNLFIPLSKEDMKVINARMSELGDIIQGGEAQIKELTGQSLEDQVKTQMESRKAREDFNNMTQAQLTTYIEMHKEAKDKYVDIAKDIYSNRFGSVEDSSGANSDLKDRMKAVDLYIGEEQNKLKQQYLNGEIEKSVYLQKMEELELESLRRKLDIYGLDADTQKNLISSILDHAIKVKDKMPSIVGEIKFANKNDNDPEDVKKARAKNKKLEREESLHNQKLKNILQQRDADEKESLLGRQQAQQQYTDIATSAAGSFGEILGGFIGDSETAAADFQYNMLMLALDTLRQMVMMWSAELFGKMVAKFGPVKGAIMAAAGTALINGVFTGVKASIKRPSTKLSNDDVNNGKVVNTGERVVAPGREAGGYFVTREQDGKEFNANYDPSARGYVNSPTVLVGESGKEWVASNDAVSNPTIKPFIDLLDSAQRKGTIRTIDVRPYMAGMVQGRESGGYISNKGGNDAASSAIDADKLGRTIAKHIGATRAYVVLSDFEAKQKIKKDAQDLFTKKPNKK